MGVAVSGRTATSVYGLPAEALDVWLPMAPVAGTENE